jgi:hypothetical protein
MKSAYIDGELCALNSEGVPVFSRLQTAMDEARTKRMFAWLLRRQSPIENECLGRLLTGQKRYPHCGLGSAMRDFLRGMNRSISFGRRSRSR